MLADLESLLSRMLSAAFGPKAKIQGCEVDCKSREPVFQCEQFVQRAFTVIVLSAIPLPGKMTTSREEEKTGSCSPEQRRGLTVTSKRGQQS